MSQLGYRGVVKPQQQIDPHSMPVSAKLEALPFSDGAYEAIRGLVERLTVIGDCLAYSEETRCAWAALKAAAQGNENGPALAKLYKLRKKLQ